MSYDRWQLAHAVGEEVGLFGEEFVRAWNWELWAVNIALIAQNVIRMSKEMGAVSIL
jgi:hypothetical protein